MSRLVTRATVLTVSALLAAGLLGGCGDGDIDDEAVKRNSTRLAELYRQIMGRVTERTAGERLAHHSLHDPIQACASAAGLPDLRPPFVNIYAGRSDADLTVAFSGDGWLTPLGRDSFGLADDQLRLADAQPAPGEAQADRLSPADRERYQQIQDSCEPPAEAYTDVQYPPGAVDLNRALDDMITAAEARPVVREKAGEYQGCMKEAGFPDVPSPTALSKTLTAASPPTDAMPLDGRAADPQWQAYVARERKAAKADAGCREDIYGRAMTAVGPDLDRFESEHGTELAEVRKGWADLVERAGKLGQS